MGVAIGGLTREVRSASLAAFVVSLPVAALALIPSGAVDEGLYDVIRVVSAVFPFRPASTRSTPPSAAARSSRPLLHLVALTLAFGVIARLRCVASPSAALYYHRRHGLPRHPPAPPPRHHRHPRPGARDGAGRAAPRLPDVRRARQRTAARRSRRCRASTTSRSATRCRRPARPPRSASRPCCCSGCRPPRTRRAPARGTTRASSSSPRARSRPSTPTCWSSPTSACASTRATATAACCAPTAWSTTTPRSSCSPAPRSPRPPPAPTPSRPAT